MREVSEDINKSQREYCIVEIRNPGSFETASQVTNYDKAFESGSLHQIPGKITTLLVDPSIEELRHGGLIPKPSRSGNTPVQVPCY